MKDYTGEGRLRISSVDISVYRFFMIFQSADIAGIAIEKISPYWLFSDNVDFLSILKMYIEIIFIKYLIITHSNLFLNSKYLKTTVGNS